MMILAIDIGNTNSVFAVVDETGRIFSQYRVRSDVARTGDEYFVWLSALMTHDGFPLEFDTVVLSSTVPRAVFNIRQMSNRYFNRIPIIVGAPNCIMNLDIKVDSGVRVGPDRLVNTLEAYHTYGGPFIVVDFGTATNFDCGDQNGAYIGGAIAPGVNLSLKALSDAAAALPTIEVTRPESVIGTNTLAAMQTGIFWGYVGLVEGITKRIRQEHDPNMKAIATGGLASLYSRGTDIFDELDRDLTIRGLARIAVFNS